MRVAASVLAFLALAAPAAWGKTGVRAIIIDALPANDTPFTCVDVPPPGTNDADVWVDSNGDGLPGPDLVIPFGVNVAVDVWIDTGAYAWTNFFIGLGVVPDTSSALSYWDPFTVTFHVTGGETFPLDNFTLPWAIGVGGFLYPEYSGLQKLFTLTSRTHRATATPFCFAPIVSTSAPEKFFSSVGRPESFSLFCAGTVDSVCYTILPSTAEESATWGRVKALFR